VRLSVEQGDPYVDERMARRDTARRLRAYSLLDGRDELPGNSIPVPGGSGATSISQIANWPWPPDCLTCRPRPADLAPKVSRSDTL
jgi:hypothetical protein